ncbi:amidohydrolase [Lewinella sp. W8]|uniref:amidohydrolase n=1 Tax=Lewinella sp. W8 TaxID=2528208 RepID=UPI0010683B74|nr:amidohydrolase [Lewinella sp. W8]MTB50018.1 amidohydrolase [Lewinella sp. W8]
MRYLLFAICLSLVTTTLEAQKISPQEILNRLDQRSAAYGTLAHTIWEYAEVGYQEEKSSALLQEKLRAAGFSVEAGVADIPTAFVASYGSGKPVIGLLAEFDALPGVSQEAVPEPRPRPGSSAGHACGHHLFGAASTAAAISLKEWLEANGGSGTIKLFGTPAEEGGAGKVYMVRAGLFDEVDAVIQWHPSDGNSADAGTSLSNKSAKFRFYGAASHAAAAPESGRSALDGVEAMNYMVNLMREHVPESTRIHYVITSGGEAPNVVPAFAEVFYYVRHPQMRDVRSIFERVVKAAEGAALGTGTTMEYEVIHGSFNLMPNETLARVMHANLEKVGGITYDPEEQAFAEAIVETLPEARRKPLTSAGEVQGFRMPEKAYPASTDVGDVSWTVPTAGLRTATWVPGTPPHSWQAVAAGGTSIGTKGMMVAAKTLTLTGIDLFTNPELCTRAQQELNRRRGADFKYEALLGDREPPLDYRN